MNQDSLHDILAHIKKDPKMNDAFLDNLLSRKEWSNILKISRITLWRWEVNIINKIRPLKPAITKQEKAVEVTTLMDTKGFYQQLYFFS
jgi:hypothetical protein